MSALRDDTRGSPAHKLAWDARGTLRTVLREHPVVHFRTPGLSPEAHVRFAERFGTVEPSLRVNFHHPKHSKIMLVGNVRDASGQEASGSALSFGWHSDMSWRAAPPELTFLYGDAIPPSGDGDTHFANLYRLHDDLDDETRTAWAAFEVEHESRSTYFNDRQDCKTVRPLIQRHPESGRRLAFTSPAYVTRVRGLNPQASDAVLARLAEALDPPDVVHRWQRGDLLVWDNRAVLHRATEFDERELRRMWRTSVRLDAL